MIVEKVKIKTMDRVNMVEIIVVQKFNQGFFPKTRCISFSGVLFGSFCTNKKNNKNY